MEATRRVEVAYDTARQEEQGRQSVQGQGEDGGDELEEEAAQADDGGQDTEAPREAGVRHRGWRFAVELVLDEGRRESQDDDGTQELGAKRLVKDVQMSQGSLRLTWTPRPAMAMTESMSATPFFGVFMYVFIPPLGSLCKPIS